MSDRLLKKVVELKDTLKRLNSKMDHLYLDDSLNQFVEPCLGSEDVIYLISGFDGISFLSSFDSSPSDILTPLKPIIAGKSYASPAALDGKLVTHLFLALVLLLAGSIQVLIKFC